MGEPCELEQGKPMKRLAVFCDGTWQRLDSKYPTNVIKLAQATLNKGKDGVPQLVFYDEGVGTDEGLDRYTGGAFGHGLDKNVLDCYRFLILNFEPGDELYFFGFSRGAYTVRSLCGLIYKCGIPARRCIRRVGEAYQLYRDRDIKPDDPAANEFRASCGVDWRGHPGSHFGKRPYIKVLGCWDTVGSLGIPDRLEFLPFDDWVNAKYEFHDTKISPIIEYAFHAMAIDERRRVFDVTRMLTSNTVKKNPNLKQEIVECWFVGGHGSVGGGGAEDSGLSNIALNWMIKQLETNTKLTIDPSRIGTASSGQSPTPEDPLCPFDAREKGFWAILGDNERKVEKNDLLHETVFVRWKKDKKYRPKNLKGRKAELDA